MSENLEITGKLWISTTWSESLQRYLLTGADLIGGDVIGITHELLADVEPYLFTKVPNGFQIDGHFLEYLGEYQNDGYKPPHTSVYKAHGFNALLATMRQVFQSELLARINEEIENEALYGTTSNDS